MGDVIPFPEPYDPNQYDLGRSERMAWLLDLGGKGSALELGTPEEWGQSAHWYLMAMRHMAHGGKAVEVSVEAIDFILGYVDLLTCREQEEDFPQRGELVSEEAVEDATERLATRALKEGVGDVEASIYLLVKAAVEIVFSCASFEERKARLALMPHFIARHVDELSALETASLARRGIGPDEDEAA